MAAHRTPAGAARNATGRLEPVAVPVTAGWGAAGMALAATALVLVWLLPPPLVLLATGSVLATAGFVIAGALLLGGRRMGRDGTAGWDLASALVFLGLAAVLITDAGEALTALAEFDPAGPR